MTRSRSFLALAALCLSGIPSTSHALALSGTVLGPDGQGKPGVEVSLKRGELVVASVLTAADGTWLLDGSTRVVRDNRRAPVSGRLSLDATGRIHLSFQGRDIAGRGRVATANALQASTLVGARATADAGIPDTLVYSFESRVFLRDTLSESVASGIVRTWDTTWNAQRVYGTLVDARDQKTYRTVGIGNQVWMAENLGFRRDTAWTMRDSALLGEKYGLLYQWAAAMDTSVAFLKDLAEISLPWRGVCPTGWHLPSEAEWSALVNLSDSATAAAGLKALEFAADTSKVPVSTDAWGFRVLPGGQVMYNTSASRNVYYGFGSVAIFWTASEYSTTKSWSRTFTNTSNSAVRKLTLKTEGYSVRCLQD